ncbi:MAG: beta-propeller fold lactonase family protein [Proteobacteria bacterium]|nr:beta-propeller fold lactonase family protein [Pseudomonadota bacterium]
MKSTIRQTLRRMAPTGVFVRYRSPSGRGDHPSPSRKGSPGALRRIAQIAFATRRASGSATIMLAGLVALSTGILFWQSGAVSAVLEPTGSVYTADEYGNSISRIDLATGQVETVPVPISPHNVDLSADGGILAAVGEPAAMEAGTGHGHGAIEHGTDAGGGLLLVFDSDQLRSRPLAEIVVGKHPAHVIVDAGGGQAFVTQSEENSVAVVDLSAKKIVKTIETGRYPHGLRLSPDGKEIYVANVEDGSVSVIATAEARESARIPVGAAPVQVGFTPDGRLVFASLRDENKVAVIDTARREVVTKIGVGRNPIQVFATPDGSRVYVANQGGQADPDDTVSVIDVATLRVVDTIRTGKGAHGVSISPDGSLVFVTNIVDGTVSVIDEAARSVVATIRVGLGPNGIAFRKAK